MKKRLLVAAASTAAILGSYAQINSPAPDGYMARAVTMYDDGNYYGCIDQLLNIDEAALTPDELQRTRYYRALATVHTDKAEAIRLLTRYLALYPESLQQADELLALGDCYYGSDYAEALAVYRTVNTDALDTQKLDDLTYRMAYSYMQLGNYGSALPLYEQLAGSPVYGNAATFYRGYIAYAKGEYQRAEQILSQVDTSTAPGSMADFYLSQIYFMDDDFAKALSSAKSLLRSPGVPDDYAAEIYRIAGESSYQLGDDAQAVKYLERYISLTQSPLPSALYILGYTAYGNGDYDETIEYLTPVSAQETAMGQSAYLYLGQAYLHAGDYSAAAMAFNRALNMDYDPDVRETAYYNYAVASANGGKAPFASTVKTFTDFLRIFPRSQYAPQVQDYIINSYLTDGNYTAALQSINEMSAPTDASLRAKQRVLYVLGVKALATSDFTQALVYLDEANTLARYDKALAPEVSLALGEAYYRKGDYRRSATEIQKYIKAAPKGENLPLAYYDLAYALYAQKKYAEAAAQLELCLKAPRSLQPAVVADAYNRLGDCYYFGKDFAKAQQVYDKAYETNPQAGDYALFQKALMAGYQREYRQKIDALAEMQRQFPQSALIPDAMLETTESHIQLGENAKALDVYRSLVERYPNMAQGRQGYLQMALVKLNTGDRAGAMADYREVVRRYPTSDEAAQAVEQMKRLAAADGTMAQLTDFLRSVENAPQIDASEAEQLTFEAAERDYLTEHKTQRLEDFLTQYPDSNLRPRALSYLMEYALSQGSDDRAYAYAVDIVEQYPESSYAQTALIIKATGEEAQGKGNLALRTWKQLAQTSSSAANLLTARMGVIRNGVDGHQVDDVMAAAQAVAATSGVGADDMAQAVYSLGWALDAKGRKDEARAEWLKTADQTDLLYGIVSAQSLAESYLGANNLSQAEKWAKKVANADSPHTYWIARGFITLSDVYAAQGDKYKARQYLEAVRDNYDGTETDIYEMIDQRLK